MTGYIPERGDVVWIDLDPRVGREQSGHRPVLVLSPVRYNRLRGLLIGCPMTSRLKGYAFEIIVSHDPPSAVLVDQVRALDWHARGVRLKDRVAPLALAHVSAKLETLLGG